MANQSDLTRKEQVLAALRAVPGAWVDGPELANEEVGGSEGLRRLRDLKADGYLIQERPHPSRSRAVHQYRLMGQRDLYGGESPRVALPPADRFGASLPPQTHSPIPPFGKAPTEEDRRDWTLVSAIRGEYRCEFWIRSPKQRIIGTIALDFDRSRWFWSVKQPLYHGKAGPNRPERSLGSGTIPVPGPSDADVRKAREEAKWAVVEKVKQLKEADSL